VGAVEEAVSLFHVSNSVSVRIFFQLFEQQILHTLVRFTKKPWHYRPVAGRLPVSLTQRSCSASTATAKEEGSNEHHQEHDKENLGDTRGGARDTTEAQYGSDNGNDQECDCPTQHGDSPYGSI
jgi:hypothetical protein